MEVSPSLVGGRLVVEDVDVGELMGSRRRCHTSKGEDALIALGEDATIVEEATTLLLMLWFCKACAHEGVGGRVHEGPRPVCTGVADKPSLVPKVALHGLVRGLGGHLEDDDSAVWYLHRVAITKTCDLCVHAVKMTKRKKTCSWPTHVGCHPIVHPTWCRCSPLSVLHIGEYRR